MALPLAKAMSQINRCTSVSEHSARIAVTWTCECGMSPKSPWVPPCSSQSHRSSSAIRHQSVCWMWTWLMLRKDDTRTVWWCQPLTRQNSVANLLHCQLSMVRCYAVVSLLLHHRLGIGCWPNSSYYDGRRNSDKTLRNMYICSVRLNAPEALQFDSVMHHWYNSWGTL